MPSGKLSFTNFFNSSNSIEFSTELSCTIKLTSSVKIKNFHAETYFDLSCKLRSPNALKSFKGKSRNEISVKKAVGSFFACKRSFCNIADFPVPFLPMIYLFFPSNTFSYSGNSTKYLSKDSSFLASSSPQSTSENEILKRSIDIELLLSAGVADILS